MAVRRKPAAAGSPWTRATIALLGTISDPKVAAQVGLSVDAVKAERKRRGIAAATAGRRPRGSAPATVHRTVKLTPDEAAATDAAAGERPWTSWARDRLLEAARDAGAASQTEPPT